MIKVKAKSSQNMTRWYKKMELKQMIFLHLIIIIILSSPHNKAFHAMS